MADSVESFKPLFNNPTTVYPIEAALETVRIIILDEGIDVVHFYEF